MVKRIDELTDSQCTGCKLCGDICPTHAISYYDDNQGFWYPKINMDKCTNCGLCAKKCPSVSAENIEVRKEVPDVYALWSKDEAIRISSTSGGAFWEFASHIIKNGGVVAGAIYCDDWKSAKHVVVDDMSGLEKLKGSKYFQSDTQGIYSEIKEKLEDGKKVLFCGTPCQNAALYKLVGDSNNLIFLDFICRSINSPKAFRAYIDELEKKYGSHVCEVHLKNKKYGWHSLATKVTFENGREHLKDKTQDWWVKGFIYNDLYTRESCFECKYKTLPRKVADITIGDFWGIQNQSKEDEFKGISVALINSPKGKALFEDVKDRFIYDKRELKEVLPCNPALLHNPIKSTKQSTFFELLDEYSFSEVVSRMIIQSKMKQMVNLAKRIFAKLKRINKKLNEISLAKYLYYNYFCKNIIRTNGAKLIPYKGAILDLDKTARIYLDGKDLLIGVNKLKHSKAETHIRMSENAKWFCNNGAHLFYNTVLEVKEGALFESGFFSVNGGSVIIAHKHIKFGEDVMLGRNVIIYDSDFHQLRDKFEVVTNLPEEVIIEDHVWLTSNIEVLKGVHIEKDSLVAAYTTVTKDIPEHVVVAGGSSGKVISNYINWNREAVPIQE